MPNPLRIKASGSPVSSTNFLGLQTMTDAEVKNYVANIITTKFATVAGNGTGTADLNVDTANALTGTSIGTFVDTTRPYSIGQHPVDSGNVTTTTYYAKQIETVVGGSVTNRAVGWTNGTKQLTDGEIGTNILDLSIAAMVAETSYTAGQYRLQASAPAGGTWVSRYTLTDTAIGGNTTTYLWQKTVATSSADTDLKPIKTHTTASLKEMSSAEIEEMVPLFRDRIISTGIGTYKLQTAAPGTGTWVQMGNSHSNTIEQVNNETYTGFYTGAYTGAFTNNFANNFTGNYAGNYVGPKTYTGSYSGTYATAFTGNYATAFSAAYSSNFAGTYTLYYGGYVGGNFTGNYTGYFTGFYTGNFTGYYTGNFTGNYTGNFVGTGTYSGTYTGYYSNTFTGYFTGFYSGAYTGNYVGATVSATKDTISTVALWVRTV